MHRKNNLITLIIVVVLIVGFGVVLNKFVFNQKIQLKSEKSGNINILLLGRGGGTHDGPDLTDTMMLAMINPDKNRADLVSIPRDLWIPSILSDKAGKINSVYADGQKINNQGLFLTKAIVEKVTGQNIDYAVVIDFSGFVKLVDYLGGIDVNVASTLDDYNYPIEGKETDNCGHQDTDIQEYTATVSAEQDLWQYFSCRYKHLHVEAGTQHMDGETALEFSRSRHGVGEEGSDFARSRRQQEVISAIRTKVLSLGIILNPVKVLGIFNIVKDNINTDIQVSEFDDFINLARRMQNAKIQSFVIDSDDNLRGTYGLLTIPEPTADKQFQFILAPRVGDGNFTEIQSYVKCIADGLVCSVGKNNLIIATPTPQSSK
ncbi:MAG TPA: LCP family protein [Patescibacteria group bacterium]|nr:LCP family protein [Patescibacteria group bacterium]